MISNIAAETFQAGPWVSELDASARKALLDALVEAHAEEGAELIKQGQVGDRIRFLLKGSVALSRIFPARGEELVATLNDPSAFGESSFFRQTPSLVTVRVTKPAWLLELDRPSYERFRETSPHAAEQFALAAVRIIAERFDLLDMRVSEFLSQQEHDHPRATEWAAFRSRLFEDPNP